MFDIALYGCALIGAILGYVTAGIGGAVLFGIVGFVVGAVVGSVVAGLVDSLPTIGKEGAWFLKQIFPFVILGVLLFLVVHYWGVRP
jgi:hypothetical protein